jgi:hypothetical protein
VTHEFQEVHQGTSLPTTSHVFVAAVCLYVYGCVLHPQSHSGLCC